MNYTTSTPAGFKETKQEIIEIKLWEVYLLYNRNNLFQTLSTYSLDNGPVEKGQQEPGRVSFRFMKYDWDKTIKTLLYDNRIPVVIQSNTFAAVQARGRHEQEEALLNF